VVIASTMCAIACGAPGADETVPDEGADLSSGATSGTTAHTVTFDGKSYADQGWVQWVIGYGKERPASRYWEDQLDNELDGTTGHFYRFVIYNDADVFDVSIRAAANIRVALSPVGKPAIRDREGEVSEHFEDRMVGPEPGDYRLLIRAADDNHTGPLHYEACFAMRTDEYLTEEKQDPSVAESLRKNGCAVY
jgi:hypothetical protein